MYFLNSCAFFFRKFEKGTNNGALSENSSQRNPQESLETYTTEKISIAVPARSQHSNVLEQSRNIPTQSENFRFHHPSPYISITSASEDQTDDHKMIEKRQSKAFSGSPIKKISQSNPGATENLCAKESYTRAVSMPRLYDSMEEVKIDWLLC